MSRHDALLFRFRELEADVVDFLAQAVEDKSISSQEMHQVRYVADKLGTVTKFFDKAKGSFTFKKLAPVLLSKGGITVFVARNQDEPVSNSSELNRIRGRIVNETLYAITQHIPLLRFRIIFYVIYPFCKFILMTELRKVFSQKGAVRATEKLESLIAYKQLQEEYACSDDYKY